MCKIYNFCMQNSFKYKSILLLFFTPIFSFAQQINRDSIQKDFQQSLAYLAQNQCTQTIECEQYSGEWDAYMQMKGFFFLLGTKSKYRDSNCFTTTGIHNILAEIYLTDSSQKQILPMLQNAFPEIRSYSAGVKYNFWKLLPPRRDLRWGAEPNPVPRVHRPTTFLLEERFINNAANVENDADDTAMGNLAVWYHQKIFGIDTLKMAKTQIFDNYLDKNRKNRHWYNYLYHGFKKSGAYMTWLGQEAEFDNWCFFRNVEHNLIFFLPASICYPIPYKPYIPWGTNDVDVVVNANVLTYLAKNKMTQHSKGSDAAHQLIEKHARRGHWNRMGIYYPNRYHFHYAVARALASGDTALWASGKFLLQHLAKSQKADGSYASWRRVNKRDILQSTAYASLSLLYLKEAGFDVPKSLIANSIAFMDKHKIVENNQTYWHGGVYFSGGTVVRNMLYFTSDAYTTALVALCYQKYSLLF